MLIDKEVEKAKIMYAKACLLAGKHWPLNGVRGERSKNISHRFKGRNNHTQLLDIKKLGIIIHKALI